MKILIIKMSAIGDILQCFPILGYCHAAFPNAVIDWAVERDFSDLLLAHPRVRRVIPIATRTWRKRPVARQTLRQVRSSLSELTQERYDCVFDLQGNVKSALVTLVAKGKEKVGFSWKSAPEWPAAFPLSRRYQVDNKRRKVDQYLDIINQYRGKHPKSLARTPRELAQVSLQLTLDEEKVLGALGCQKSVGNQLRFMICLGSHWKNKQLSLDTWQAFLAALHKKLAPKFFFPAKTPIEREKAHRLCSALKCLVGASSAVLPPVSLPLWQRVMGRMDGVIAVDSAALHLAATTSTRVFGIFGPSSAHCYGPENSDFANHHGEKTTFHFQGRCPYNMQFIERCPKLRSCTTGACLKNAAVGELIHAFFTWWKPKIDPT